MQSYVYGIMYVYIYTNKFTSIYIFIYIYIPYCLRKNEIQLTKMNEIHLKNSVEKFKKMKFSFFG